MILKIINPAFCKLVLSDGVRTYHTTLKENKFAILSILPYE